MRMLLHQLHFTRKPAYGKIKDCMINHPDLNLELKPKLISSLLAGFEAVANHVHLIILPDCA